MSSVCNPRLPLLLHHVLYLLPYYGVNEFLRVCDLGWLARRRTILGIYRVGPVSTVTDE